MEINVTFNSEFTMNDFVLLYYSADQIYLEFAGGPVDEAEYHPRVLNNLAGKFGGMKFGDVTSEGSRICQVSVTTEHTLAELQGFGSKYSIEVLDES